eukprot:1909440-Amphidinium_carterae.2
MQDNHFWPGPSGFRITVRVGPGGGVIAWTARCPFHKLSQRTLCKKHITVTSSDDSARGLRLLYHWCNCAVHYNRKRDHASMNLRIEPPTEEYLSFGKSTLRV